MGLDMYLTKKTYIGAEYEHRNIKGTVEISQDGKKLPIKFNRISCIDEKVGYWRKANQIHKWFVDNVQDGEDDCGNYSVSKEQLLELLEICRKVKDASVLQTGLVNNGYTIENGKKTPEVEIGKVMVRAETAQELLPTQSGFFFGNTDYNEYYMADINDTIEIIEAIVKEESASGKDYWEGEYYYSSSW